jgi:hypothetical protein
VSVVVFRGERLEWKSRVDGTTMNNDTLSRNAGIEEFTGRIKPC